MVGCGAGGSLYVGSGGRLGGVWLWVARVSSFHTQASSWIGRVGNISRTAAQGVVALHCMPFPFVCTVHIWIIWQAACHPTCVFGGSQKEPGCPSPRSAKQQERKQYMQQLQSRLVIVASHLLQCDGAMGWRVGGLVVLE